MEATVRVLPWLPWSHLPTSLDIRRIQAVLRGAAATLARETPNLIIEIEERHNAGALGRIGAMLASLGYAGHFIDGHGVRPLADFNAALDQDPRFVTVGGKTGRYINNFIFVPGRDASNFVQQASRLI